MAWGRKNIKLWKIESFIKCVVYTLLQVSLCFSSDFLLEDYDYFTFLSHYYIVRQKSVVVLRFLFAKFPNFVPT